MEIFSIMRKYLAESLNIINLIVAQIVSANFVLLKDGLLHATYLFNVKLMGLGSLSRYVNHLIQNLIGIFTCLDIYYILV